LNIFNWDPSVPRSTSHMLTSFGFLKNSIKKNLQNPKKQSIIFPKSWIWTGYFSNSTKSSTCIDIVQKKERDKRQKRKEGRINHTLLVVWLFGHDFRWGLRLLLWVAQMMLSSLSSSFSKDSCGPPLYLLLPCNCVREREAWETNFLLRPKPIIIDIPMGQWGCFARGVTGIGEWSVLVRWSLRKKKAIESDDYLSNCWLVLFLCGPIITIGLLH
jgi:hypothetical protein